MPRNNAYLPAQVNDAAAAKKSFGERVRTVMNDIGWTQSELARKSGIPRDAISNYVRGLSFPDPKNLKKLAATLNISTKDLIPTMGESISAPVSSVSPIDVTTTDGNVTLRINQKCTLATAIQVLQILNPA